MSYYKKLPVLDEKEQAEFDKYLREQYVKDLELSREIIRDYYWPKGTGEERSLRAFTDRLPEVSAAFVAIFDKLATPRIYLLRDWIHRRQEEKATSDEGWKEHPEDEKK